MKNIFGLLLCFALFSSVLLVDAIQKDKKPWTEWNQKDTEKMLSNSPWAQIQKDTDTSEMFFQPTADPNMPGNNRAPNANTRLEQGATNQATNLNYGIRFFSARPIRQAFIRSIQLQQKKLEP